MPMFVVCPECEGTGRDASTAYALTSEDLDLQCGDDWDARRDFVREVANLTQPCPLCRGRNVVTPEAAAEWEDEAEYRAECAREAYWAQYC